MPPTRSLAWWLLLQFLALAVSLQHVPLAAGYPTDGRLALHVLLIAQICGAAMLSPILFSSWPTATIAILSAWPMQVIAAGSAALPPTAAVLAAALLGLWVVLLYLAIGSAKTDVGRQTVSATASLLATAGGVLPYLASEFGLRGSEQTAVHRLLPVPLALKLESLDFADLVLPAVMVACAGLACYVATLFTPRCSVHPTVSEA